MIINMYNMMDIGTAKLKDVLTFTLIKYFAVL